jgi:cytochrome P450
MPFGDGPHTCIGFKMALLETKIIILRILSVYNIALANENQSDESSLAITSKMKYPLKLKLTLIDKT